MPFSSTSGLGGRAALWVCYGFSASRARPQAVGESCSGCPVRGRVYWGVGRGGVRQCAVCAHGGTATEGGPRGGPKLPVGHLWQLVRAGGGGGRSRALCPLSPAPSPSLPHLTVLARVHGGAQGAAKVFDKVPGVAEGANDTVLVRAVGVGHQPFVGALGCPDRAPHLPEWEQPQGPWGGWGTAGWLRGAGKGWGTHHPALPYLCEAHKEELVVSEPQGWQALLLPILLQPGLVRLWERCPEAPGRDRQAQGSAWPRGSGTHVVGCLEPAVVSDVLAQCLPAVDLLAVDGIAAVLLCHTGCPVLEGLQGGVLPPRP